MKTNNINNQIIELYTDNKVLNDAYKSFRKQLSSIPDDLHYALFSITNDFFGQIKGLNLDKLFISITQSNSLFFRFSNYNSNYEFKFEIFSEYDSTDEKDIESILHLYKNGEKENSYFGTVQNLFNIVKNLTPDLQIVYGFNTEYTKEAKTVYSRVQNYTIPETPSP